MDGNHVTRGRGLWPAWSPLPFEWYPRLPESPHLAGRGMAPGLRSPHGRPEMPGLGRWRVPEWYGRWPAESPGWMLSEEPRGLRSHALGYPARHQIQKPWEQIPPRYQIAPEAMERARQIPVWYDEEAQTGWYGNVGQIKLGQGASPYLRSPEVLLHEYGHALGPLAHWAPIAHTVPGWREPWPAAAFRQDVMGVPEWPQARNLAWTHQGTSAAPAWGEAYAQYPNWVAQIPPEMREWYPWLESALPWGIRR